MTSQPRQTLRMAIAAAALFGALAAAEAAPIRGAKAQGSPPNGTVPGLTLRETLPPGLASGTAGNSGVTPPGLAHLFDGAPVVTPPLAGVQPLTLPILPLEPVTIALQFTSVGQPEPLPPQGSATFGQRVALPEPGTLALLGLGFLATGFARRRS